MRKLVVGCGYLGQRVAAAWHARGDEVWALTRSPDRAAEFESRGWRPVLGDVTAPDVLRGAGPFGSVLYAVGFDRSSRKTQREVYVDGLAQVVQTLRPAVWRWLYVSSSSVYGQEAGEWVDETSSCQPATPNGKVCVDAEQVFEQQFGAGFRPVNILRLSGIYGPGRLIARADQLQQGLPISGVPHSWLNLIHVDDATAAVLAVEDRGAPGETYLVTDDEPLPRRDFYAAICRCLKAPDPTFEQPPEFSGLRTPGLNKRLKNHKLKALGFTLKHPTVATGLPAALAGN